MTNTKRAFAILLTFLVIASVYPTAVPMSNGITIIQSDTQHVTSETTLVVTVDVEDFEENFNDDDFTFTVKNGTQAIAGATIRITNNTDGSLYDEQDTTGFGTYLFENVPVGIWAYNVTWDATPDLFENGTIESNGPQVLYDELLGNIDGDNDDDDLNVTFTDADGDIAEGLNFTIINYTSPTTWEVLFQMDLGSDGLGSHQDISIGNYSWLITIDTGDYSGTVLAQQNFTTDGTILFANLTLSQFTGSADYQDLEVYTSWETTLDPLEGAIIDLMYYNGTLIDTRTTSANGSIRFIDLPISAINVTITYDGKDIGVGNWFYNLTLIAYDIRPPTVTGPGNITKLEGTPNITITWQIYDEFPGDLEVFVDGISNTTVDWTNETEYTFNATGLAIGVYDIKLVASDELGKSAENVTVLTIREDVLPVIDGPDDLEFYWTETGYTLRWNVTEDNMHKYTISLDDDEIEGGYLNPDLPFVEITLNNLGAGLHEYIFMANDTSGNSASDSVNVTVLTDDLAPVITYTPDTVSYPRGEEAVIRNWTATDDYMDYYTIEVDGIEEVHAIWDSEDIEFDFAGLDDTITHTVTLTVYDLGGNSASSTVEVVVTLPTAILGLGLVAGIVAAVVVIGIFVWFAKYR